MKKIMILLFALVGVMAACTEKARAKKFGGIANAELPCGKKLINITFKGPQSNLWMLTRDLKPDDVLESYEFKEDSSWGVFEGTIKIQECRKN